jgi:putative tryptophan/tyrosine transport system substrate-binding protein
MRRRDFIRFLGCGSLVFPCAALAQQSGKQTKIGWLSPNSRDRQSLEDAGHQAFRQSFEDLGHVQGRDVAIVFRYAHQDFDQLPSLAAELVEQKVDIIVTVATQAAVAARKATSTIPIVAISVTDPVGRGLVESLARPGGNVTGLAFGVGLDIFSKGLDFLKEAVPSLQMVAVLANPTNPFHEAAAGQIESVAQALNVHASGFQARRPKAIAMAFEAIAQAHCGAVFVLADALFAFERAQIAKLALRYQLPSMHQLRGEAEAGGLMSYGPDFTDLFRRAAKYVDAIMKGAKPTDLPVQQPSKFTLVINLTTAKALGITIPPSLLVRADEVME